MRVRCCKKNSQSNYEALNSIAHWAPESRVCNDEGGALRQAQDKIIRYTQNFGFTLVELLIVMAIIAILVGIVIAGLGYANMKARNNHRLTGLNNIDKALVLFYSDNSYFPSYTSSFDDIFSNDINEYMEGSWESPGGTSVYYRTDLKSVVYIICINQEQYLTDEGLYSCKGSGLGRVDGNWPDNSSEVDCQNPMGGPDCGAGPVNWDPSTGIWSPN